MNDPQRIVVGVSGIVAGISLAHVATLAAVAASVATAVFMGLSAWEKWQTIRANRSAPRE
jgi:hypothetical protein